METTLAILMVLGIFVGIPALIGFAIAGTYIVRDRRAHRAVEVKTTEALTEQAAEVHGETVAKEATKELVQTY